MNCCEIRKVSCPEDQNCPVCAARDSGVCCTEPDVDAALIFGGTVVLASVASFAVLCGVVGYAYTRWFA